MEDAKMNVKKERERESERPVIDFGTVKFNVAMVFRGRKSSLETLSKAIENYIKKYENEELMLVYVRTSANKLRILEEGGEYAKDKRTER
jgi:hypothetical protein